MNNENRNIEVDFHTGVMNLGVNHQDINSHNKMGHPHHHHPHHHPHHDLKHHFDKPHHGMECPQMPCPPMDNCNVALPGTACQEIKCPIEKVCQRDIHHQVTHVQPVHTRIINRHIYNHCCVPHFTCSEENVCCHNWMC